MFVKRIHLYVLSKSHFNCAPQKSILFFAPLLDVSKPWMPTFRGLGWDGAYQDYMSCLVIWCGATMLRRRTQVWRALIKRWICLTKTCNWSKNLVMQHYRKISINNLAKPLKFGSKWWISLAITPYLLETMILWWHLNFSNLSTTESNLTPSLFVVESFSKLLPAHSERIISVHREPLCLIIWERLWRASH